jgi:hypothetical protein
LLEPQVNALKAERQVNGNIRKNHLLVDNEDVEKNQYNMLHWCMNHIKDLKGYGFELGDNQLNIAFVAIHTTSMTASHAIYDLAATRSTFPSFVRKSATSSGGRAI